MNIHILFVVSTLISTITSMFLDTVTSESVSNISGLIFEFIVDMSISQYFLSSGINIKSLSKSLTVSIISIIVSQFAFIYLNKKYDIKSQTILRLIISFCTFYFIQYPILKILKENY